MAKNPIRQNLFTKHNPNAIVSDSGIRYLYEFTMYRAYILYNVPSFRFRGLMRDGYVELETYGLIVRKVWFEGLERKCTEYDMQPLSSQQYEVSGLLHVLCRAIVPTDHDPDQFLIDLAQKETVTWNRNDWGNPFGKVAENLIKEQVRQQEGITIRRSRDELDTHKTKRSPLARLSEMFQQNPTDRGAGI